MKHSTMLYKHPGPHDLHGGKYDYVIVDEDDVNQYIIDGWCLSTPEALAQSKEKAKEKEKEKEKEKDKEIEADNAPPTREELETKATELGIHFDGRTSDAKLMRSIDKALSDELD